MGYDFDDAGRDGGDVRRAGDSAKPFENTNGKDGGWRSHTVSAAQLRTMAFPPISYVVPGLVPEGLSILAGKPKIGKSWLALEIAIGIAGEHIVLGGIKPTHGDVLYGALEDTNRRLQRRITKLLSPFSEQWPTRLTLATRWRKLDDGGVDDIFEWCSSVPEPRLVILDTLAGVRPERQQRDTPYDGDYRALLDVHKLANERGLAVMALHHTRKMEAEDPLDTISGTLGLVGCADTALVLARTPQGTTLYVRGRDVEESEHAISFDAETCRWSVVGEATEVRRSETRQAILAVLAGASNLMSPDEIALATSIKRNTVHQRLPAMLKDNEVVQVSRAKYCHPMNAGKYRKV